MVSGYCAMLRLHPSCCFDAGNEPCSHYPGAWVTCSFRGTRCRQILTKQNKLAPMRSRAWVVDQLPLRLLPSAWKSIFLGQSCYTLDIFYLKVKGLQMCVMSISCNAQGCCQRGATRHTPLPRMNISIPHTSRSLSAPAALDAMHYAQGGLKLSSHCVYVRKED